MRLEEAKSMVEMFRTRTNPQGITYASPPVEIVTPEFAGSVADSLITALQLAHSIVTDEASSNKFQLTARVRATVARQITDCLESARQHFPHAESFRGIPPHLSQ
jgi:hypothetical protein